MSKLWSERDFDECCYAVGGHGNGTMVCAKPSRGSYCDAHLKELHAYFAYAPKARVVKAQVKAKPKPPVVVFSGPFLERIAEFVASAHGLEVEDITSRNGRGGRVEAQQEFYALAYSAGRTTTQIGKFCGRDRSTVSHGLQQYNARVARAFARQDQAMA